MSKGVPDRLDAVVVVLFSLLCRTLHAIPVESSLRGSELLHGRGERDLREKTIILTDPVKGTQRAASSKDFWNQGVWYKGKYHCTACFRTSVLKETSSHGYGLGCAAPGSSDNGGVARKSEALVPEFSNTEKPPPPPPIPENANCPIRTKDELVEEAIRALHDAGYKLTAEFVNTTKVFHKLKGQRTFLAPIDSAYDRRHLPSAFRAKILGETPHTRRRVVKKLMKFHVLHKYQSYHKMLALTNVQYKTSLKFRPLGHKRQHKVSYHIQSQAFCLKGKQYLAFDAVPDTKRKALVIDADLFCNNLVRIHGINNVLIPANFLLRPNPSTPSEAEAPEAPELMPPLESGIPTAEEAVSSPTPSAASGFTSSSGLPTPPPHRPPPDAATAPLPQQGNKPSGRTSEPSVQEYTPVPAVEAPAPSGAGPTPEPIGKASAPQRLAPAELQQTPAGAAGPGLAAGPRGADDVPGKSAPTVVPNQARAAGGPEASTPVGSTGTPSAPGPLADSIPTA